MLSLTWQGEAHGHVARVGGRVALPRDRRRTSGKPDQGRIEEKELRRVISKGKFPDVQRRSRGSATLPRHARRYADTPIRVFPQVPVC